MQIDISPLYVIRKRECSQGGAARLPLCTPPAPEAAPNILVVRASGVFFRHLHVSSSQGRVFALIITAPPLHSPRARGDAQPPVVRASEVFPATSKCGGVDSKREFVFFNEWLF